MNQPKGKIKFISLTLQYACSTDGTYRNIKSSPVIQSIAKIAAAIVPRYREYEKE
jgi:hypothetical protein